jgi:tetratricopeptide (TPR) repeat protein
MHVARGAQHKPSIAFVLILKGMVCETQGDRAAARAHLEEAIALSREVGEPHQLAQAIHASAELHRGHGNLDGAQQRYEEALALQRQLGDSYESAICLLNLARVAILRRSADSARSDAARSTGDRRRDRLAARRAVRARHHRVACRVCR